jgi:tellurite resistance protein
MRQQEVTTMDFFPEIDVSALQAEAIARGLYAVAAVDGVHERELALIAEFHNTAASGDAGDSSSLAASVASFARITPLEPEALAPLLDGVPLRELFIKAALLLAWADGGVSAAERAKIGAFGKALAVSPETQAKLEAQVKDYLLRPLAHLANVEAASAVAKKLGA